VVGDCARASCVAPHVYRPFVHNDVCALHAALREGKSIVFVAVALESVYSMDGTMIAPLFCATPDSMGLEPAGWSRCSARGLRVLPFGKVLAASDVVPLSINRSIVAQH